MPEFCVSTDTLAVPKFWKIIGEKKVPNPFDEYGKCSDGELDDTIIERLIAQNQPTPYE